MTREAIGPRGTPTTVCLLNGHGITLPYNTYVRTHKLVLLLVFNRGASLGSGQWLIQRRDRPYFMDK